MKQVRIRVTCDACAAWKGADTEDGVETVPVGSGQTLDLCADHREGLRAVLALIAEWGATPERASSSKRRWVTPTEATSATVAPAANGNTATKRGGKRARQRRANAEAGAAPLPLTCPLCEAPSASADALGHHVRNMHSTTLMTVYGGTCPVCGNEGSARGLGTHAAKAHQMSSSAALFALAQQQGDPHSVLAARAQAFAAAR